MNQYFKENEQVRFLDHNHCIFATIVKINKKSIKIKNNNGYCQNVKPEKLAKLDELICIIEIVHSKYCIRKYVFDRVKYPSSFSVAKYLPIHSWDGSVQEDETGSTLSLGKVHTKADFDVYQDKLNKIMNILDKK